MKRKKSEENYRNSNITELIDEYIHNKKYRKIMKLRFIDGYTFEAIAEEVGLSARHISNIVNKCIAKIPIDETVS